MTLSALVGEIDSQRRQGNLSSAVRLYVLDHYRGKMAATPAGDQGRSDVPQQVTEPEGGIADAAERHGS